MKVQVLLIIYLSVAARVLCTSYYFGDKSSGPKLINREKVKSFALPWIKRVEYYSYNDTDQRTIQAIDCYDYQRTEATVVVTKGGVGFPFVEMCFTSQRSYGLEYAIEIFA